jgi:hypothetical protein
MFRKLNYLLQFGFSVTNKRVPVARVKQLSKAGVIS